MNDLHALTGMGVLIVGAAAVLVLLLKIDLMKRHPEVRSGCGCGPIGSVVILICVLAAMAYVAVTIGGN